jgi:predicted metalloprotease
MTEYTEGVIGDGAVILRDGVLVSISEILELLNEHERMKEIVYLYVDPMAVRPEHEAIVMRSANCGL